MLHSTVVKGTNDEESARAWTVTTHSHMLIGKISSIHQKFSEL